MVSLSEVTHGGLGLGGLFLYLLGFQMKDVCWYEWIIENSNDSWDRMSCSVDVKMLIITETVLFLPWYLETALVPFGRGL